MPETLEVRLLDRRVGSLTNLATDQNFFEFDESFVSDPSRPTLSLSFLDEAGNVQTRPVSSKTKLPPFFSNLLPEGHLRSYLAEKAHVNEQRDFPLIWILGQDLPGAVVATHASGALRPPKDDDLASASRAEMNPAMLRFSLAGVQLKFSAIMENDGGLTIPVHGQNGLWILKMPSSTYKSVPENEYSMMTFAREVGIDVPETHLVDPATIRNMPPEIRTDLGLAFYVRRFDRDGDRRIHTEDFAQVFSQYPAQKYENVSYGNILSLIMRVMGEAQAREFVRRLVFNIGIGNADMHLKNWSLIYRDRRTPELAPAYDYLSTIVYIDDDRLALTLARNRDWRKIDSDSLVRVARRGGIAKGIILESAREMVQKMRETWPTMQDRLLIPKDFRERITKHMNSVPIFGARGLLHVTAAAAATARADSPTTNSVRPDAAAQVHDESYTEIA